MGKSVFALFWISVDINQSVQIKLYIDSEQ